MRNSDSRSRDRHLNIAEKTEVEDILRMCEINLTARFPCDAAMLATRLAKNLRRDAFGLYIYRPCFGIAAAISGSDVTKDF